MNKKFPIKLVSAFLSLLILSVSVNAQKHADNAIKFTNFSVSSNNKKVVIDWATDNKVPVNYFEIQKSEDGKNFKTIALILGPDPQQPACDCYGCFDKITAKSSQTFYYRLKHVAVNGEEQLSETKLLSKI